MKYVRQFFRFLYDFLVGDAWELFVGPIAALLAVWVLVQMGLQAGVTAIVLVLLVVVVGGLSLRIALRGSD